MIGTESRRGQHHFIALLLGVLALMTVVVPAAHADEVELRNGDRLKGTLTAPPPGSAPGSIGFTHPLLGRMTFGPDQIARVHRFTMPVPLPSGPTTPYAVAPGPAPQPPVAVVMERNTPLTGNHHITPQIRDEDVAHDDIGAPDPEPRAGGWSHSLAAALSMSSGNTDTFDLFLNGESRYEGPVMNYEFGLNFHVAEASGDTTAEEWHGKARAEAKVGRRAYYFGEILFDRDELAGLEYRFTGTVGYGRTLIETSRSTFKGEVGLGAIYEKYEGESTTIDPSAFLGLDYEYKFVDDSVFTADFDFIANLGDFDRSFTVLDLLYSRPVCDGLNLTLGLRLEYTFNPPTDAEELDTFLTAGIKYDF